MADLAITVCSSYNSKMCAKNEFSADLLQSLPSRISPGSPVYCKPFGQQKKSKDSFPHAAGFCADGIFILAMYLVFTVYIGLSLLVGDIDYFLPSKLSVSKRKRISNDQELIQSDPTSWPQNQKGNN